MQELLQLTLDKGTDIRCSNWETCPLSFEQKAYAATDAYAAVKLYQVCWRMAMLCVIATETLLSGFLALDLRPFLEGNKAACHNCTCFVLLLIACKAACQQWTQNVLSCWVKLVGYVQSHVGLA